MGKTLVATPHSLFVCTDNGEDANPSMDVDASASEVPDYGDTPGVVSDASMVNLDEVLKNRRSRACYLPLRLRSGKGLPS